MSVDVKLVKIEREVNSIAYAFMHKDVLVGVAYSCESKLVDSGRMNLI